MKPLIYILPEKLSTQQNKDLQSGLQNNLNRIALLAARLANPHIKYKGYTIFIVTLYALAKGNSLTEVRLDKKP